MLTLNTQLFLILMVGLVFDWLAQTDRQATAKFSNPRVRAIHSLVYAFSSSFVVGAFGYPISTILLVFCVLWLTHFLIDDRRLVSWWMTRVKRIPKEQLSSMWWMSIAIDQWFHVLVIFLIALAIA